MLQILDFLQRLSATATCQTALALLCFHFPASSATKRIVNTTCALTFGRAYDLLHRRISDLTSSPLGQPADLMCRMLLPAAFGWRPVLRLWTSCGPSACIIALFREQSLTGIAAARGFSALLQILDFLHCLSATAKCQTALALLCFSLPGQFCSQAHCEHHMCACIRSCYNLLHRRMSDASSHLGSIRLLKFGGNKHRCMIALIFFP